MSRAGVFEQGSKGMLKTGAKAVANQLGKPLKENLGNDLTANLRSLVENEPQTFHRIDIRHLQFLQPTHLGKP